MDRLVPGNVSQILSRERINTDWGTSQRQSTLMAHINGNLSYAHIPKLKNYWAWQLVVYATLVNNYHVSRITSPVAPFLVVTGNSSVSEKQEYVRQTVSVFFLCLMIQSLTVDHSESRVIHVYTCTIRNVLSDSEWDFSILGWRQAIIFKTESLPLWPDQFRDTGKCFQL